METQIDDRSTSKKIFVIFFAIAVTIIGFLPRGLSPGAYWTPDEERWIERSLHFTSAIKEGRLKETIQSYHPGVLTMWVGGISLYPKYQHILFMFNAGGQPSGVDSQENLQTVRMGMAVITTFLILSIFFLLRALTNFKIAAIASILLALDPWYLMESRRVHTDAFATGFLILSLLSLLLYWEKNYRIHLLISGICFGLSCLSKVSSLPLAVYYPLGFVLHRTLRNPKDVLNKEDLSIFTKGLLVWTSAATLTVVILFPALWVTRIEIGSIWLPISPILISAAIAIIVWGYRRIGNDSTVKTSFHLAGKNLKFLLIPILGAGFALPFVLIDLEIVLTQIKWALTTPHEVSQMFLGKVVYDPGWFYYPVMVTIYSTPAVLLLSIIGFLLLAWQRKRNPWKMLTLRVYLYLIAFLLLYLISISLGAKKLSRYALPAALVLDIMAAISLWTVIEEALGFFKGSSFLSFKRKNWRIIGLPIALIVILGLIVHQIFTVVMLHPNYSVYYNPLWGAKRISQVTTMGRGEGIKEAAHYLNQKEKAEQLIVRVSPLTQSFFKRYFRGETSSLAGETLSQFAGYDVIYIRDLQAGKEFGLDAKHYENRVPEYTVQINRIPLMKIYKVSSKDSHIR